MFLQHLECSACGRQHQWSRLQNLCLSCQKPLLAVVDLTAAGRTLTRESVATREKSLWRYREVLPLPRNVEPISLGEGATPLLCAQTFDDNIDLWIKDESLNPTQSFKARGMSVAVSMAKYLGATKLAVPSAGNAGGALAAYAARARLEAHIFMPRDTPRANIIECRELGAHVTLIDGLITDCAAEIARRKTEERGAKRKKAGSICQRSRSRIGSRVKRRLGTNWRNNATGSCRMSFFIPPAAAPV
jgi:threonine synthase